MSLDNKLKEIFVIYRYHQDPPFFLDQIEQAFIDEGYMTGQEFYDRFKAELHDGLKTGDRDVLAAAKRAAKL